MNKKKRFISALFPMIFDPVISDHWEEFLQGALDIREEIIYDDIMKAVQGYKQAFLEFKRCGLSRARV